MRIELVPVDARDLELVRQAAGYSKQPRKCHFADCFAAALAKIKNAELVTGDREFKQWPTRNSLATYLILAVCSRLQMDASRVNSCIFQPIQSDRRD